MTNIHPNQLWIGHAFDIRDPQPLFDTGIKAVVDVAYEELPAQLPRQLIYCRFPLNDGGGNEASILLQSVSTLVGFLKSKTPTIVGCSAGMSRSPTIAAFALAIYLHQTPDQILRSIANKKTLEINGSLWNDVASAIELD